MRLNDLPDWQKLVTLIGDEDAAALSAVYGGGRIYVPRLAGPHHPMTEAIGRAAAEFGHRGQQGLRVGEVVVEGPAGDPGRPDDLLGPDARIAPLGEGRPSGGDQRRPGRLGARGLRAGRRAPATALPFDIHTVCM